MAESTVLNLILWLPVLGMLALALAPRLSDRAVRGFTFGVMLLQLVLTAWLYVRFDGTVPGLQFETAGVVDRRLGRELPHRPRRPERAAGGAHRVPRPAGGGRRVQRDHAEREAVPRDGVLHPVRDAGHVPGAGPVPVLRVLGSDADPDVPDHRHLGRRAAHLRHGQVRPLHRVRQHPDAGGGDLPGLVAAAGHRRAVVRVRGPRRAPAVARGAVVAARRVRALVRHQGADGAAAHLVARRARRGAHRGLRDPGGRAAEDGHLRLHEARLPAVPGRDPRLHADAAGAVGGEHRVRRLPGAGAVRHQESDRLLVDQPPGLRDAGPASAST